MNIEIHDTALEARIQNSFRRPALRASSSRKDLTDEDVKFFPATLMHDVLAEALSPLQDEINLAFVYGSVARSREREQCDVDVMLVGNVDFDVIVEKLRDAEKTLNREINPTVYSIREFSKKLRGNFLKTVLAEKKLFIIGDEDDLRNLGQKHLA